jgi:transmembrane sensor
MDNLSEFPIQDKRYTEASAWIAKLDRGITSEEEAALCQWLAESDHNGEVLQDMAKVWDKMYTLGRLSAMFPRKHYRWRTIRWRAIALAATLAATAVVGSLVVQSFWPAGLSSMVAGGPEEPEVEATEAAVDVYEAAVGEHSTVNLRDGTEINLNTSSVIRVNYTDRHRLIYLEQGEIHVRVKQDKLRPLSVIAGDSIVQAVGTAFNVKMSDDEQIELVVTHGEVAVASGRKTRNRSQEIDPVVLSPTSVSVFAGQTAVFGRPDARVSTINADELAVKLAWREGKLIFRGEPLVDAIKEVSRYTAVEFVFMDSASKDVRVAGRFKSGDLEGLLFALKENFAISHERIGDDKIALSSMPN